LVVSLWIEVPMTDLKQATGYQVPAVENAHRPGLVVRVVLLALVLIASAAAFIWFQKDLENEIVLGILGVLAMAGTFFIVSAVTAPTSFRAPSSTAIRTERSSRIARAG
jgi:hypothetical protein